MNNKDKKEEKLKKDIEKLRDNENSKKEVKVKWAPILIVGFLSLFCMILAYSLGIKVIGKENYNSFMVWLESHFGLKLAIFLYTYILDTLVLPLSPDLVWMVGAGMKSIVAISLVGLASTLGGFTSYFLGYLIDKIPPIRRLTVKINAKWSVYIKAYGVPFLIMAAILPLPYSTICLVAGLVHLGPKKAFPPCLLRFVHAALYYYIFRAGLLLI